MELFFLIYKINDDDDDDDDDDSYSSFLYF